MAHGERKTNFASLYLSVRQCAQQIEQMRQRRGELAEIAGVQALVWGVGVSQRLLDAEQERRSAAEHVGQRTDEADRTDAAVRLRFLAASPCQGPSDITRSPFP